MPGGRDSSSSDARGSDGSNGSVFTVLEGEAQDELGEVEWWAQRTHWDEVCPPSLFRSFPQSRAVTVPSTRTCRNPVSQRASVTPKAIFPRSANPSLHPAFVNGTV